MTSLQFGTSSYERDLGDLPGLPVVNMFAEVAPTEETGIALQSRHGLADRSQDMGSAAIGALYRSESFASGALIGVADGRLWKNTTNVGAIAGAGKASIAAHAAGMAITAGTTPYYYDGTTLSAITFPDSANVIKVISGGSRLVFIRAETDRFYWTPPLGSTVDALAFATAESSNDILLDGAFIDDTLILAGSRTVEFWPNTSDADLPFQPLEGRVIEKGVKTTGCLAPIGPTFAWVTNDNRVALGTEMEIIGNPGLDARIAASSECSLFNFTLEGAEFLALRIDGETQVWNLTSRLWSEFASEGYDNWLPVCHADGVFGASQGGKTLEWGNSGLDLGGELERRFRAGLAMNGGALNIVNILLRCNTGQTPYLSGDYVEPTVAMRLSRDGGKTWGAWQARRLGRQGEYRARPAWRACGVASHPGILAEFRVTDPVDWRVSDVRLNEPYGGR